MVSDKLIIPECYLDTNLIETLIPPVSKYNYQKSCSKVAGVMHEDYKDSFALGIIDNDKVKLKYFNEFNPVSPIEQGSMVLLKHSNRPHYIIKYIRQWKDSFWPTLLLLMWI